MDQNMITLVTNIQFSKERLEEIYSVPKTKQLFEQFIKQEKNESQIKELIQRAENIFEKEGTDGASEYVDFKLKSWILADSIESVINGKPLNQAIQAELKKQLKEETVIEKVAASERMRAMSKFLSGLVENMLS